MAFRKPPMLISSEKQYTIHPPMKIMILTANELEKKEDVINVTVNAGFPYADTPKTGPGIIVTTNNSQGLAEELAELLKNLAWTLRKSFLPSLTSVENTMHIVKNSQEKSIILADYGDNVMGGGPGDGTVLLKLLLESQEDGACVIYDPQAVNEAVQAGVGKEIELTIGGKTDLLHGEPIKTKGYIRLISDGKYFSEYVQGVEVKMGRTVVFKSGKTEIIITENKTPQFDPQLFLSVGIDPSKKKILVLKSQHAFRVLFGQFAKEVIEVDTPGITGNIKRLIYHKVQRPIFPIDDNSIG
jgi:microcystin degradation protein MlrC